MKLLRILSLLAVATAHGPLAQAATIDAGVVEIIQRLTLEEKVGQMTNLTLVTVATEDENRKPVLDPDKLHDVIVKYHVGSIQNVGSGAYRVEHWHELIQALQDYTLAHSSHKIPNLYCIDSVHGANYVLGATQFPHNLGLGATRNKNLVRKAAQITAAETRAAGIRQNYSPVLDVGRNQQWSRLAETFGEDTYIVTELGRASVEGLEGDSQIGTPNVAASIKHYVGYADPNNGRDRAPAYIPEIVLREHHLPQFQAAVDAGARTVMVNSGDVNGVPVHASKYLLTDVLRGELGFGGVVVSDWEDIKKLHERHKVAATFEDAVFLAIDAGIDMVIVPMDFSFSEALVTLVEQGRISEERIDESVARILTLKKQVGLFENPDVEEHLKSFFGKPQYQEVALQAARESLVLLKNEGGVLPLANDAKVLLTGPTARHASSLHGAWSYSWQGNKEALYPDSIKSVKAAFAAATYRKSVEFHAEPGDIDELLKSAREHDVILVAIGEDSYAETPGNIQDLAFPPDQVDLVRKLATTGKPIVAILLSGRPRILREIEPLIDGLIVGFWPGSRGADAIHDVVFGDFNPSGKLPITYPRYSGTLLTYDHKLLDEAVEVAEPYEYGFVFDPQYEFGAGLSYTTFEYSDLNVKPHGGDLKVSVTVTNTGERSGQEVVEVYTRDWYASITPSIRRLRRFEKINLEVGESKTVDFTLRKEDVAFVNASMKTVFEPGNFDVTVGTEKQAVSWQ